MISHKPGSTVIDKEIWFFQFDYVIDAYTECALSIGWPVDGTETVNRFIHQLLLIMLIPS